MYGFLSVFVNCCEGLGFFGGVEFVFFFCWGGGGVVCFFVVVFETVTDNLKKKNLFSFANIDVIKLTSNASDDTGRHMIYDQLDSYIAQLLQNEGTWCAACQLF